MVRATKIVATLGPASSSPEVLERMLRAGVDVVRLNFSHGKAQDHIDRANLVRECAARVGKPGPACAWEAPTYLSLGTYPWVYGNRLTRTPPGLDWDRVGPLSPAASAMRLCASMWQPEDNLRQDARPVVFAYRYYRQATEPLLAKLPVHDVRTAVPGALYRRGLLLHAEQSSLEIHTLMGTLGPLAANAHNYIIGRYAAFFALRRSLLAGIPRLTPEQQRAIASNPDPCLRPYAARELGLSA